MILFKSIRVNALILAAAAIAKSESIVSSNCDLVPIIEVEAGRVATRPSDQHIRHLISELAKINEPYAGLSPTTATWEFAPVPGATQDSDTLLGVDHRLQTPNPLIELVKLGPRALPVLLEALDDRRPTGLVMEAQREGFMFGTEFHENPLNKTEAECIKMGRLGAESSPAADEQMTSYRVKVGDVCFVIIGQIVGRPYMAVRYQPSMIIVLNSPTSDPYLCRVLRRLWSSSDPEQCVLDSLLIDFNSNQAALKDDYLGWLPPCTSATRMLYYYPRETTPVVVDRLRRLDIAAKGSISIPALESSPHNSVETYHNGVWACDFVMSIAWCREKPIQVELLRIFKQTNDVSTLAASLPGAYQGNEQLVLGHVRAIISGLPPEDPDDIGLELLIALGKTAGLKSLPIMRNYLSIPTLERCHNMSLVLGETCGDASDELLAPLLEDKRNIGRTYRVNPGNDDLLLPVRVCDEAAEVISKFKRDLPFRLFGLHTDLDNQIQRMREIIRRKHPKEL